MSKKTKFRIVITAILIAGAIGLPLIFNYYNTHETSIGYALNYPPKTYSTPICTFISPRGWEVEIKNNKFNKESNIFATLMRLPFGHEKEFPARLCGISLFFQINNDEKRYLKTNLGKFAQDVNATRTIIPIEGKDVIFYRYEGPLYPDFNPINSSATGHNNRITSVTIGFCSDFGFGGFFWGLPENEKGFWKTVKSIKWKL